MDKLLAKLTEQQAVLDQQNEALRTIEDEPGFHRSLDHGSSSNSLPITPATETFRTTAPTTRPASANFPESQENDEVLHLKLQLAQAKTHINKLEEIAQNRTGPTDQENQDFHAMRNVPNVNRENTWNPTDDTNSESSDPMPMAGLTRSRGIWGGFKGASTANLAGPVRAFGNDVPPSDWARPSTSPFPPGPPFSEHQTGYPSMDTFRGGRLTPDSEFVLRRPAPRAAHRYDSRANGPPAFANGYAGAFSGPGPSAPYDPLGAALMPSGQMTPTSGYGPMAMNLYAGGPPGPPGNSLSPHASEFTSNAGWRDDVSQHSLMTQLSS